MSHPKPPQIEAAFSDFCKHLAQVEGSAIDPMVAPFAEMEAGVIKMLGGNLNLQKQEHRVVAFMVGATLGMRLEKDLGAFWFPNRSSGFGAVMGLAEAVAVVSPIEAVSRALAKGRLSELDELTRDLRSMVARATLSPEGAGMGGQKLGPEDYQRLFDPGLAQVAYLDGPTIEKLMNTPTGVVRRELEDAISRTPPQLPDQVKAQLRAQIGGALGQMDADKLLGEQLPRATSLCELLAWIYGTRASSGLAPEELWRELVVPLLHIGAAEKFPALDADDVAAIEPGSDPLLLYVDIVPFATPAADEDGVIGVFPVDSAASLIPMEEGFPRLVQVDPTALQGVLSGFDPIKLRASIAAFRTHVVAAGAPEPGSLESPLLEAALTLINDIATVAKGARDNDGVFCVRRATEAEASSEAALHMVREALRAPRIILA